MIEKLNAGVETHGAVRSNSINKERSVFSSFGFGLFGGYRLFEFSMV